MATHYSRLLSLCTLEGFFFLFYFFLLALCSNACRLVPRITCFTTNTSHAQPPLLRHLSYSVHKVWTLRKGLCSKTYLAWSPGLCYLTSCSLLMEDSYSCSLIPPLCYQYSCSFSHRILLIFHQPLCSAWESKIRNFITCVLWISASRLLYHDYFLFFCVCFIMLTGIHWLKSSSVMPQSAADAIAVKDRQSHRKLICKIN